MIETASCSTEVVGKTPICTYHYVIPPGDKRSRKVEVDYLFTAFLLDSSRPYPPPDDSLIFSACQSGTQNSPKWNLRIPEETREVLCRLQKMGLERDIVQKMLGISTNRQQVSRSVFVSICNFSIGEHTCIGLVERFHQAKTQDEPYRIQLTQV